MKEVRKQDYFKILIHKQIVLDFDNNHSLEVIPQQRDTKISNNSPEGNQRLKQILNSEILSSFKKFYQDKRDVNKRNLVKSSRNKAPQKWPLRVLNEGNQKKRQSAVMVQGGIQEKRHQNRQIKTQKGQASQQAHKIVPRDIQYEYNTNSTPQKRYRRSIREVKQTYRCLCGKMFVSYSGIYLHLKGKHLPGQENKQFFLRTLKHKTKGDVIKQVVLVNKTLDVTNINSTIKWREDSPLILQILNDDDDDGPQKRTARDTDHVKYQHSQTKKSQKDLISENTIKSHKNDYIQQVKQKQQTRVDMQKHLTLTYEHQELLYKYFNYQKDLSQRVYKLKRDLDEQRKKVSQLQDINKELYQQNQNLKIQIKVARTQKMSPPK